MLMKFLLLLIYFTHQSMTSSIANENSLKKFKDEYLPLEDLIKFEKWMERFNKSYDNFIKSKDDAMKAFFVNLANIEAHNKRINESYERSLQLHSDLTFKEKKKYRMGVKSTKKLVKNFIYLNTSAPHKAPHAIVNHTRFFPPAKDQEYCGGCYAFSVVSIFEYMARKVKRKKHFYSEQNIIDCDFENYGCEGGWPAQAFDYVFSSGISNGLKYVFKGFTDTCKRKDYPPINVNISKISTKTCSYDLEGDENKLKILVDKGPVVVCISTTDGFTSYRKGIFYDPTCPNNTVDHAIVVVGYGRDDRHGDFWIIRNSWGPDWGMKGYGWMARNRKNHCGIALYAMIPC